MDKPDGSNATLRMNLMGEHSQRIEPHGNKPRRMDETSWQQPRLMGDNTSRRSLMECTAAPIGSSHAYWLRSMACGRTYWENLLGEPCRKD